MVGHRVFIAFNIGQLYAQVRLLFDTQKIENADHMCNLEEKDVSPGYILVKRRGKQVATEQGNCAVFFNTTANINNALR